ncbi:MAG: DUF2284 domain-containing protein [Peptococcaceae bacterium]|nr:DUF2284 domain-containing protein [Peptococcaceae bacterium]MDH7524177.1 DUF2284 domain-containing protein [Peptococcaceae bacterium]
MPGVENQIKNCLLLQEEALKLGCERAQLIWAEEVVFDPRVTLKCRQNLCSHYGKNFMCPPFVPTSEEFKTGASKYRLALLVVKEQEIEAGLSNKEKDKAFKRLSLEILGILTTLEKKALEMGFSLSLGLGGGNCKLCEICGAKLGAESCNKPAEARPSMEAAGIDVMETCRRAQVPVSFREGSIQVVGLLLIV